MLFTLLYSCDREHGFPVAPSDSDGVIPLVITLCEMETNYCRETDKKQKKTTPDMHTISKETSD